MRWSKSNWFRSLRGRLLTAYAVGMLIVAAVLSSVFMLVFVWQNELAARHHLLENIASDAARHLQRDANGRPLSIERPQQWQWLYNAFPGDIDFRVVDAQGRKVLGAHPQEQLLQGDFHRPPEVGAVDLTLGGVAVQLVTVAVPDTLPGQRYYFQVAASHRLIELIHFSASKPVGGSLVLTLLVSIPVLIGLMLLALRSLLRPLRETSEAAARITPRNLSARLSTDKAPTELVPLLDAFNQTLERLEQGFRAQQQFLGSATHELKTPLALMRGQIELDGTADRETLLMDIDVMARQVHQLLHLAEASEAGNYQFGPLDSADVAVEVLGFLSRLADRRAVQLDMQLPAQAVAWQGDKGALFTLVKNLLENAIQHSAPGGVVTLSLDAAGLSVRDEGQGIAPEHRAHLFERFWRGPRPDPLAPQGAGLGLSICQEIALAHGWRLQVLDTATGTGSLFRLDVEPLRFPIPRKDA